jgi:hypothetical protein
VQIVFDSFDALLRRIASKLGAPAAAGAPPGRLQMSAAHCSAVRQARLRVTSVENCPE